MTKPGERAVRRAKIARAAELHAEGVPVAQIAVHLATTEGRVRRYLESAKAAEPRRPEFVGLAGDNRQRFLVRPDEIAAIQDFGDRGCVVYLSGVEKGLDIATTTEEVLRRIAALR
jgi:hypothetical protein